MDMTFFKGQRTLPDHWTDEWEKDKAAKSMKKILSEANEALKNLRALARKAFGCDNTTTPTKWHLYSEEWVNSNIDRREAQAREMPLPSEMIDRAMEQWEQKRSEAMTWCAALNLLRTLQKQGAKVSESIYHLLTITNMEELLDNMGKVGVPVEAVELWRLIQNVRDDYQKVMRFCKERNLKEMEPYTIMKSDDPQRFVNSYLTGFFSLQPTAEQEERRYHNICHDTIGTKE